MVFKGEIRGAKEFTHALRAMQGALPKIVRETIQEITDLTTTAVIPKVPRGDTGEAYKSVRSYLASANKGVVEGGGSIDYYRILELGGHSGRRHATYRVVVPDGRYIYPTYQQKRTKIDEIVGLSLRKLSRVGLKVN